MAAVAAVSGSAFASGTVWLNNYDADKPVFYLTSGSAANGADFYAEIWGGPVGGTLSQLKTEGGTATAFALTQGYFDAGYATIPGVADSAQATLELRAYKGTSYATAEAVGKLTWNQATGTAANLTAEPPVMQNPATLNLTGNALITAVVVPEPSTIALGMLGAAALLIRRRK